MCGLFKEVARSPPVLGSYPSFLQSALADIHGGLECVVECDQAFATPDLLSLRNLQGRDQLDDPRLRHLSPLRNWDCAVKTCNEVRRDGGVFKDYRGTRGDAAGQHRRR